MQLANKKLIAVAAVLCDMLKPVVIFSDYLQGENVNLLCTNEKVEALVDSLETLTERFRAVGNGQMEVGLLFSQVETWWDEINYRTTYAQRLRDHIPINIHQFAEEFAIPIVYSLIGEIRDAFFCSPVLGALGVYNLDLIPDTVAEVVGEYGDEQMKTLAAHYGQPKTDVLKGHRNQGFPKFPEQQYLTEFQGFRLEMRNIKRRATEEQLKDSQYLLKYVEGDQQLAADYPAMKYLVLVSCLAPTSTAVVERVFSLMNSVLTPSLSSMKKSTLDNIMRIIHTGQDVMTTKQLDCAIRNFNSIKDRKV